MAKATAIGVLLSCVFRVLVGYRQKKIWNIKGWKILTYVVVMTVIAVLGAKLSAGIAYGNLEGVRMYGTILLAAATMPLMAWLLRVRVENLYGVSALNTWVGLVFTKGACIINGCCYGIVIAHSAGGVVRFPSAIVETVLAAAFFVWFCILARREKYPHGLFYPLLLVWYGIYRYAADWLRGDPIETKPFVLWIPAGRFFSAIIFIIGAVSMYLVAKKLLDRKPSVKEYLNMAIGKAPELKHRKEKAKRAKA